MNAVKKIEIETKDTSPFYYGEKVYMVGLKRYGGRVTFREKCLICSDTRVIILKGIEFKCPLCSGIRTDICANYLDLYDYTVIEYIINEFSVRGPTYKNAYQGGGLIDKGNLPNVGWKGFAKFGNGFSDVITRNFYEHEFREVDLEKIDLRQCVNNRCFLSKAEAERFCKWVHERQKEMLNEFNIQHGTDHHYPFGC